MTDKTILFNFESKEVKDLKKTLKEVEDALTERGYNAYNQIVGYLISGDLGYISSHKDARRKMQELDRAKIVEILLSEFQGR